MNSIFRLYSISNWNFDVNQSKLSKNKHENIWKPFSFREKKIVLIRERLYFGEKKTRKNHFSELKSLSKLQFHACISAQYFSYSPFSFAQQSLMPLNGKFYMPTKTMLSNDLFAPAKPLTDQLFTATAKKKQNRKKITVIRVWYFANVMC